MGTGDILNELGHGGSEIRCEVGFCRSVYFAVDKIAVQVDENS